MTDETAIPSPALVVLVGPSGSGKSTWADANFREGQVLSSDHFRALLGAGPDDQTASGEAFDLLHQLTAARLGKGLTTVIDTLGFDDNLRAGLRDQARQATLPCVAVGFDTAPDLCHQRNAERHRPVPKTVLDKQLRRWREVRDRLADEGFDQVTIDPGPARPVSGTASPARPVSGAKPTAAQPSERSETAGFGFDLVVSRHQFGGENHEIADRLTDIARAAERAGFRSLQVMDHFRQVPQVGRAWEPILECFTALTWVAARTTTLRIGSLVANVEHRNVGLLAKIVATLDVLSSGRVECGLGAGWFDAEQAAYGYPVNTNTTRLDTLEEALQALPILWGPGSKSFSGSHVSIPEALAYPRPFQDPVPILVGGGGEQRTLQLAARYAKAANVMADQLGRSETVSHKISVLDHHCREAGRDPGEVAMTVLAPVVHASTGRALTERIEGLRPRNRSAESFARTNRAGTTDEHAAWFRSLAEVGVSRACVALTGSTGPDDVEAFGPVIDRLSD